MKIAPKQHKKEDMIEIYLPINLIIVPTDLAIISNYYDYSIFVIIAFDSGILKIYLQKKKGIYNFFPHNW